MAPPSVLLALLCVTGASAGFSIVSGGQYCTTTDGGACVTDGVGYYTNSEQCTIRVTSTTTLSVLSFSTESFFDRLTVGGVDYSGTVGPNGVAVTTGDLTHSAWRVATQGDAGRSWGLAL